MIDETDFYKRQQIIWEKLEPYGFIKEENGYYYEALLLEGQFNLQVVITNNGQVMTILMDTYAETEYVLHRVRDAQGQFIGSVRAAYEEQLAQIAAKCFAPEVFRSPSAKAIIAYIEQQYGDNLEFLWEKHPDTAVYRRKDSQKWYLVIFNLSKKKLGFDDDGTIEIIDVRVNPDKLSQLIDNKNYFHGYHMNKRHWLTVSLESSVAIETLYRLIDDSYMLAKKK